ncbi:MAG: protein phosphatase 2C domain-containing protein [Candidatus Shapirobacteria bacterium]|nr:protein phosphatase 2C domain-containing protein [Candidatus Shapirobacteria bacterium]
MPEHNFSDFPDRFPSPKSPEKKSKQIQMAGFSQSKDKNLKNNQDEFFINPENHSFGVFDGANGAPNGKLAAETCSKLTQQLLSEVSPYFPNLSPDNIKETLQDISTKVNSAVLNGYSTGLFGVITTDSNGKRRAYIGCVGDSRAYLVHHNVLYPETRDQNYISYPNQDRLDKLKGKKLAKFKKHFINEADERLGQAYGQKSVYLVITQIDLEPKDSLLIFTDGITHNLKEREISSIYKTYRHENPETISQKFIQQSYDTSLKKDGTPDDMTAVVIKIK